MALKLKAVGLNFRSISYAFSHAAVAVFGAGLLVSMTPSLVQASQCSDLFIASRPKVTAAEYLVKVSEFETAEAFAKTISSGRQSVDAQVYEQLIAPGLWSFARLKVVNEAVESSPSERGLTDWIGKIQRDALTNVQRNHQDSNRNERPRIMTAEERMWARETGSYDMVDRPYRPRTSAQEKQAAFRDMLAQFQTQMQAGKQKEDPVVSTFKYLMKNAGGQEFLAKTHIDRMLQSPVEFAIIYAQLNGLIYYAGEQGAMLSPHIPWVNRIDKASGNSLRAVASMARAMAMDKPEVLRATDNLVLEVLQREFAPHLGFKFDVGPTTR